MILDILTFPHPLLRKKAEDVRDIQAVQTLIADMAETLYAAPGVGLAAPQVGASLKVIVIDASPPDEKNLLVLINPVITSQTGDTGIEEGCLSFPGPRSRVPRAATITVTARDTDGRPLDFTADGLLSIIIQHEVDHLNGTLFIDRVGRLKRDALIKEYEHGTHSPRTPSAGEL